MTAAESPHLDAARLDDLLDGALAGAERAVAEAHLRDCAHCRRALEELQLLLAEARRTSHATKAPPELWTLVAASTIHAARVRRQLVRSARGLLILGALVLVLATAALTALVLGGSRPRAGAPATSGAPRAPRAPQAPHAPAPRAPDR